MGYTGQKRGEWDMVRLIALDVDGTLFNSKGTVPEGAVRAIRAAREKGVRVVIATGRSAPEAVWLTGLAGCDDRAVVLGGAAICDAVSGRLLRRWDIPAGSAARVMEILRDQPLYCMVFAGEANLLDPRADGYFERNYQCPAYLDNTVVAEDVAAWIRDHRVPLTKIYAQGDPAVFPPLVERLKQLPGVSLTSSGANNFEVVPDGADKGRALCLLAGEWGIAPEDIAAIGDSDNDLAMLRAVGWPVAMGNGSDEVKAAARLVTDTNDRDGVAKAIWKLIGE